MFANRTIGDTRVPCVVFYIVCVLLIVVYGIFLRRTKTRDPLARRLFHHPVCQDIDGWSISHLLFFGLLGAFFPGHYLQFLLIGIGWEVVETGLGQNRLEVSGKRLQLIGGQDADGLSNDADATCDDDSSAYWYGKESDIIMDMLGYALGSAWALKWWPNQPKNKAAAASSAIPRGAAAPRAAAPRATVR